VHQGRKEKEMKKFRKHCIGYVASMMWEATGIRSFSEVVQDFRKANEEGEGFTIEYIPPGLPRGNWLRVEGVHLTPEEMDEAIFLVKKNLDL
jgi:hypothetical protein